MPENVNLKLSLLITLFLIINLILTQFISNFSEFTENDEGSTDLTQYYLSKGSGRASSYAYHNYTQMVEALKSLDSNYPELMELDTAQELYAIPDCRDGYKIWIVRLTNESITEPKPEILYLGGHHGDESVSIEVPFYFISWLLENYYKDPDIRYILDNRDLYVIPVLNPYGWENDIRFDGNGEDVNRDYPYGNLSTNPALTTIGTRTVHELMKNHMFSAGLTWHSGDVGIYYAWGTPLHDTLFDESPDDEAFRSVGERLSDFAGSYQGKYSYGPANQLIYTADGAWSDYAYAAAWDTGSNDPANPTNGARTLAFGVEISYQDKPPEAELGEGVDLYCSPQDVTGLIPKNIRLGFALAELAEPYAVIQNKSLIPDTLEPGVDFVLSWEAGGAVNIDQTDIQYGLNSDPTMIFNYSTTDQSGKPSCFRKRFTQNLTMPEEEGTYYFSILVRADQNFRDQLNPEPVVIPQSIFVNYRTNSSWELSNAGKAIEGRIDYFSKIIIIEVKLKPEPAIKLLEYPDSGFVNDVVLIQWSVENTEGIHSQFIHRSQDSNNVVNSTDPISDGITEFSDSAKTGFEINTKLPAYWGFYYYRIQVFLNENISILSEIITVFVKPELEIIEGPEELSIYEFYTIRFRLEGTKNLFNITTQLTEGTEFPEPEPDDLIFSNRTEGEYNRTLIAPNSSGIYSLRLLAYYNGFNFFSNHLTFLVLDAITIFSYKVIYDNINATVSITEIEAVCSNKSHDRLTPENALTAEIVILNNTNGTVYTGNLSWTGNSWYIDSIDVSSWPQGKYYVIPGFQDEIETLEPAIDSIFIEEFNVRPIDEQDDRDNPENDPGSKNANRLQFYLIILSIIAVVAVLIVFIKLKQSPDEMSYKKETEGNEETKN